MCVCVCVCVCMCEYLSHFKFVWVRWYDVLLRSRLCATCCIYGAPELEPEPADELFSDERCEQFLSYQNGHLWSWSLNRLHLG